MAGLGGPLDRGHCDQKFDSYLRAFKKYGFTRWVVEDREGRFLGYTGVMARNEEHPLGFHCEIGWRFSRDAWGQGYTTEAAKAALDDAFTRLGLHEVIAYTAPDNIRSQAVMARLKLQRDPARDFTIDAEGKPNWNGLVWIAQPS
ncbi:MAG: GNAT family N-acetyltransferase [Hyphomicrobiales bacterium]|nr:GNAT family N-acetyltransferase [Hyphomicrobiales bacterium]MCP4997330.1 GNAT family N-acetyltransferase [Hyphomicrobiales bacterium]